jgi:hypothetical protein
MRRALLAAALTLAAVGGGTLAARPADAISTAAPGAIGHDISHPQCVRSALPAGGAFGIVGVNGGRAYTVNPCLERQYDWARDLPHTAGVYINTGNPGYKSKNYWTKSGKKDPARCIKAKSASDPGCAYNYGWHAAAHAMKVAKKAGVSTKRTWWLDVEISNSWVGTGIANAADLQGAFDYLREHGVSEVGLYSTSYQWKQITGGYHASTADAYKRAWSKYFKPKHRMDKAPIWQAGGGTIEGARKLCTTSFTGAPVRMAQFITDNLDHNIMCGRPSSTSNPCRAGAPIPAGRTPVFGTSGDDHLRGTGKDEIFYAGPGADIVEGRGGADILCGGSGRDDLRGGDGKDRLYGGSGRDKLSGGKGDDHLDGGADKDSCSGGPGDDRYRSC